MKKPFILAIVSALFIQSVDAQFNISIAGGGLNYQGELGGKISNNYGVMGIDMNSLMPVAQGRMGFVLGSSSELSTEFGIAKFKGSDLHSADAAIKGRGYTVNGKLLDFGLNIHQYIMPGSKLYAIAGIKGVYSVSSVSNASDQYLTKNNNNFSIVIPVGAGLELASVGKGILKFEWTANTVLSDNLDGLDYAESKYKDVYSNILLVYSMPISNNGYRSQLQHRNYRSSYRSFGVKHGQCPQF